ncbi:MAG: hypothetical protein Tp158DCM1229571_37 [Prokaryotic dsDNA virus sp.]|nr:MAG: hypothetical protein Tp158DCM1229571_37 [Prokaryotic dsDNA virus sp.]|tara:strand:- start:50652 stop:52694 length:2043 start_codon:yes stop_codon:yes gene_type:complete
MAALTSLNFGKLSEEEAQQLLDQFIHGGALTSLVQEQTDPEQEEAFRVLAADVLKKTTQKLTQEKRKHQGLQMMLDMPGYSDIVNQSADITQQLLGDTGVGGYLKMAGMGDLEKKFKSSIDKSLGLGNNVIVNWQNWFKEELEDEYLKDFDKFESLEERKDLIGIIKRANDRGASLWNLDLDKLGDPNYKPELTEAFLNAAGFDNQEEFIESLDKNLLKGELTEEEIENLDKTDIRDFKRLMADQLYSKYTAAIEKKNQNLGPNETPVQAMALQEFLQQNFPTAIGQNEDGTDYVIGKPNIDIEALQNQINEKITKLEEELGSESYQIEYNGKEYTFDPEFTRNFIADYLRPRFDHSKSMAEFVEYLGNEDTGENLLTTQTVSTALKEYGEKMAQTYIDYLQAEGSEEGAAFTLEELKNQIQQDLLDRVKEDKQGFSGNVFMNFVGPDKYVDLVLDKLGVKDPTSEEGREALEEMGLSGEGSLDELKNTLKEQLTGLDAYEIREKIKRLVKEGKVPAQMALGIEYIQREEDKDFGKEKKDETQNAIYEMFKQSGYQGDAEDLFNEEFMEGFDSDFLSQGLSGEFKLDTSSPGGMLASTQNLMGSLGNDDDLYNVSKANKTQDIANYYKTFGKDRNKSKANDFLGGDDLMNEISGLAGFAGIDLSSGTGTGFGNFGQAGYF